jgi:uncharacterized MAPEG superfamily protein
MTPDLRLLAYSALLCWVMVLTAMQLKTRIQLATAFGNRDNVPPGTPMADRADRAAKNMLENMVLFTALIVAAHLGGANTDRVTLGARVFFWARVAYFPVYVAGITYLRTAIWAVSVAGLALVFSAII